MNSGFNEKIFKKSIFNGLIRTIFTVFYEVFLKFKTYYVNQSDSSNKSSPYRNSSRSTSSISSSSSRGHRKYNQLNDNTIKSHVFSDDSSDFDSKNDDSDKTDDNEPIIEHKHHFILNPKDHITKGSVVYNDSIYPDMVQFLNSNNKLINDKNYYECNSGYFDEQFYEYVSDSGQVFKVSTFPTTKTTYHASEQSELFDNASVSSSINSTNSYNLSSSSSSSFSSRKYFKIRAIFFLILIIIGYISINNYLIMFIYYQSSTSTSSSSRTVIQKSHKHLESSIFFNVKPLASFFRKYKINTNNNNNNKAKNVNSKNSNNIDSEDDEYYNKSMLMSSVQGNNIKIMIDPLDIEIAGLNLNDILRNKRRVLLSESYFDEEDEIDHQEHDNKMNILFNNHVNNTGVKSNVFLINNNKNNNRMSKLHNDFNANNNFLSISSDAKVNLPGKNHTTKRKKNSLFTRPCVHPKLDPYDREIMQFVKKEDELKCNPKKNWIYIENGTLRVSKSAIRKHGTIVCAYIPLYRGNNDYSVYEGNRIFPVMDKMPLITDFFKIDCRSKDGAIYSNIHSGIAYESSLHMRHIWNPMPKRALGYNVLMFGFDSVSRMSWIRMLPKSYEYMIKEGFIVMKGYNIVGDGTPQALLPILTGKKETELPEARRGFANASYVDVFPWIWKDYKKAGYVTQWAEDMQSIGTFQLRMLGFRKQPVDHYMRVFYLEAERYYSRFRRLCLGSISRHKNMFNWVKEFFLIYDSKPKFSFIFHSEASHNYNNPLSLLDDDLKEFLQFLKYSGIMDTTILMFMSDHGVRVSNLRQYSQGKLEERLPFFSVLMPKSFQEKYPEEMRNLRLNSRKLTTPFDIHETLHHLLNFDRTESKPKQSSKSSQSTPPRGISLLKYISPNRSCEDAHIEAHWCSCLKWTTVDIQSNNQSAQDNILSKSEEEKILKEKVNNQSETANDYDYSKSSSNESPEVENKNRTLKLYDQYKSIKRLLKNYTKTALYIANKAVSFINSLIDNDLEKYCEKIRLISIQKLSKLDLDRKLLTFKKSKDIHGREALFEDNISDITVDNNISISKNNDSSQNHTEIGLRENGSNNTSNSSLPNTNKLLSLKNSNMTKTSYTERDTIFQIVLTTWPGNATYELSFKYNKYDGVFKFNKNEISRINSYNGTSSCMLNKRPDLRQFCFCKYN